jgi:DNA-binding NarL/FixJ family response regulator
MKLMIVDDHSGMRQTLRRLLATPEDSVCECQSGAEAVAAYDRFRPDWVLMDIVMQELDGIAATRQIIRAFPEARVIMVTEHGETSFRQAARAAGACGFVPKDDLRQLRRLLARPPSDSSPSRSGKPRNAHHHEAP